MVVEAGASLEKMLLDAAEKGLSGLDELFDIPGTVGGAVYMNAGAFNSSISDSLVSVTSLSLNGKIITRTRKELSFGYRDSDFRKNGEIILSAQIQFVSDRKEAIINRLSTIKKLRDDKQPSDRNKSCGSVFKRPAGHYAGTLIEKCGLKGMRIGGAVVSEKHANFIINTGNATANDIKAVIDTIRLKVKEMTGLTLETEVIFLGEFTS